MGQAFYRKYRSKSFGEIIGQEHITRTLDQALKSGRISHAYLFTGPKGVGKTSIARILAHEINDLPYTDDSMHMDIIEIDAASNRRIDEIRELRDKVYVAPTSAKYKVYIIDEVHMLTREAFNALLKTLEEPPAHVIFILATTDAHKLPDTIISRTQRFTFKPVDREKVMTHLRAIATAERIKITDEALGLLAEHGEGSFRDSISLLDQTSSSGEEIALTDIQIMLGMPPAEAVDQLLGTVLNNGSMSDITRQLSSMYEQGFQAAAVAKQLGQALRHRVIESDNQLESTRLLDILRQLIEVPVAHDPESYLEITLLKAAPAPSSSPDLIAAARAPAPETTPQPAPPAVSVKSKATTNSPTPEPLNAETSTTAAPAKHPKTPVKPQPDPTAAPRKATTGPTAIGPDIWPAVLNALKQKYNTLYGVIRMAQPTFTNDGRLELAFAFAFHQKRISEAKNRQILADIIHQLSGQNIQIDCVLDKKAVAPKTTVTPKPVASGKTAADITTISNIFGGGELLES